MDRLPKMHGQKQLKERFDFPFETKIETVDRLPKMHGQ